MKKILYFILLTLFFIPLGVKAIETTDQFYMDITINTDGSIKVKELAKLSGSYNGRFRDLEYENSSARSFSGDLDSFYSSSIYNGSDITSFEVGGIPARKITWDTFNEKHTSFERVEDANIGEMGKYVLSKSGDIYTVKTFLPSSYNNVFYLEYIVKDVVVVHNDVAEINWNLLGDSYEENIDDFKARITLPYEDSDLKVWLKGSEKTLNGVIEKNDNKGAIVTFDFLGAYNPITVRMIFDKSQVPYAIKKSGVDGKDKILEVEKRNAEEANKYREKIKRQNAFVKGINVLWISVFIISLFVYYLLYDKEYKANFIQEYLRELPSDTPPEVVEYIMSKSVSSNAFSSSICNMILKKVFTVQDDPNGKKNYIIIADDSKKDCLTEEELKIYDLLINIVGNGKSVTTKELKTYGKTESKATEFINKFDSWRRSVTKQGKSLNIYQESSGTKALNSLICLAGFLICYLDFHFEVWRIFGVLSAVLAVVGLIYVLSATKKTKEGIEEYTKWKAFKHFLKDFGRFNEKELPEIALWEKYLVYATALGCANEVQKAMKVKFEKMYPNGLDENNPSYMDYYMMNRIIDMDMANTVSNTVNTAVSASRSTIAASQAASSSGGGGGASFGGGSGGGGGGGGRF